MLVIPLSMSKMVTNVLVQLFEDSRFPVYQLVEIHRPIPAGQRS
jgi:hypothetical protein